MLRRTLPACAVVLLAAPAAVAGPVDFRRDVLPILSENCFACHGPDAKARKADLRLDTKADLLAVAGKPGDSELLARVAATDADLVMPPPKFHKKLTPAQVATLRAWIEQGAVWSRHWAFEPPTRPTIPVVTLRSEYQNPIDAFVLDRLVREGLTPNPPATKLAWLRRATLDLTGLPPTPAEADAFLADDSSKAFETVADRLLASPRYGEHMARYWLDAARYGDTHGLHLDNFREMHPYRDWVVRAFNGNVPFDRFLREQLAGDLLPDPTLDQQLATGFLRCHVTTSEGGSIEDEVYVRNVADQVDTFGTVALGLTVGCAKCHDHKYDPVSQTDYYSLFAFFNSIDGSPLDGNAARHAPVVRTPTADQQARQKKLQADIAAVNKRIAEVVAKADVSDESPKVSPKAAARKDLVWIDDALPPGAKAEVGGTNQPWRFVSDVKHAGKASLRLKADGLHQLVLADAAPGLRVGDGDKLFAHVYLDPADPPKQVMLQWHTAGWIHRAYWGGNYIQWGKDRSPERFRVGELPEAGKWVRLEVDAKKVGLAAGATITGWAFTQYGGTAHWDAAGLTTATAQGATRFDTLAEWAAARGADPAVQADVREVVKLDPAKRTAAQKKRLRDYFAEFGLTSTEAAIAPLHKARTDLQAKLSALDGEIPASLVFKERATPKPAYLLKRGEYDQKGAAVGRATPGALPAFPKDAPVNRLGLADWLLAADHPLTARVAVNRFWQQAFGTGLVKTADDFGITGEPPSHPELLDYLAVEFRTSGWDVKRLMRSIVLSATYRQSAKVTPDKLAKDPANRLLARGPRFRLDAEVVRDQALFVSGLLVEKPGGASVKPPQPAGLWEAVGYVTSNTARFVPDAGPDKVYRRSLYTFWKRTAPPPQMTALDAPSREACTVRRERTNTPLQALLLMNEGQFTDAAKALAGRAVGKTSAERTAYLFRLTTGRPPDAAEAKVLAGVYADHRAKYAADPPLAQKLAGDADAAALVMVANLVLNLDEVLTK